MTTPKRDWLHVGCEPGHDMQSIGGCNAGCHDNCVCSVPVNRCTRCGECDYGNNPDATDIRLSCNFDLSEAPTAQVDAQTPGDLRSGQNVV